MPARIDPFREEGSVAQPFAREGLPERLAPFMGAAALPFALALLPLPGGEDPRVLLLAAALIAALLALTVVLPWQRLPALTQVLPPLGFLVVVSLLREAAGGVTSAYGWLVLLPVIWLALYGSRGQLVIVIAGIAVLFAAPVVVVGGADYPPTELRRAVLAVGVSSVVGFSVQRLVCEWQALVTRYEAQAERLRRSRESIDTVARELTSGPEARWQICRAACGVGHADLAILLEPDGEGGLASSALAGDEVPRVTVRTGAEPSAAALVFAGREPLFVADVHDHPQVSRRLAESTALASALFQPVIAHGRALGVLVVGWRQPVADLDDCAAAALGLLATEAAVTVERSDLEARLAAAARTDPLTGLPNRRVWDEELPRELSRAERYDQPLAVALLDLDHFKRFNDTRGHLEGDRLLKAAAGAWHAQLRDVDLLARFGGEEFALVVPGCRADEAREVVERVRAATPDGLTCSAGVAVWDGRESADVLLHRADQALYAAKAGGRDRTAVGMGTAPAPAPTG